MGEVGVVVTWTAVGDQGRSIEYANSSFGAEGRVESEEEGVKSEEEEEGEEGEEVRKMWAWI